MKGHHLGEFQEVVLLTILILEDKAYGVSIQAEIKKRLGRYISRGALHAALSRLEEKGFIESTLGKATPKRGGRRKRMYTVNQQGKVALEYVRDTRNSLWKAVPQYSLS